MVKFKSRYLLIEVLYDDKNLKKFDTSKIARIVKDEVEKNFGDIGLGKINKNLQIKYANNYTNMLIVRVGKEHLKLLRTSLALINNIDCEKCRLRIIGVSGSIKCAEKRATKFLENFLENSQIIKNKKLANITKENQDNN